MAVTRKRVRVAPAVLQLDVPAARILLVMRGRDPALELDVAAQVELVGDVIQIALGLGLAGEVLLPVPFFQQFLRKGVAVGPALGIEAGAGIAVPVPGAADAGAGFEHPHLEAEFSQLVELVEAGNTGADDDRVEIRARSVQASWRPPASKPCSVLALMLREPIDQNTQSTKTQQSRALRKPRRCRLHRTAERPQRLGIEIMRMSRRGQDQQQLP